MKQTVTKYPRGARRRLQRVIRKSRDAEQVRRATAVLHACKTANVTGAAAMVAGARSSVYRWISWFEEAGVEGLCGQPRGPRVSATTQEAASQLGELLKRTPSEYGYLRTRWSSELLAVQMRKLTGMRIHSSTIRRMLPGLGYAYRRARPMLNRRDPRKAQKMQDIESALAIDDPDVGVFYVDEADVNLNPKIGYSWRPVGKQHGVVTPGQNKKMYLAGALHAHTGNVVWIESERKNSDLFIGLLHKLRQTYRRLKEIILILDNVNTHSSKRTQIFLRNNPKFTLLFQPVYHPWVNRIERLWKALHDTVTRNHCYRTMEALLQAVRRFMSIASPFPGGHQAFATL